MFKRIFNWLKEIKIAKAARVEKTESIIKAFFSDSSNEEKLKAVNDLKNDTDMHKSLLTEDALDAVEKIVPSLNGSKGPMQIIYNFFGMNRNWGLSRNLFGGFLVHSPEYPTYFIPAYTQAKATGNAGDLKKGEGIRGLITGGLEGIAVGALVSGRRLKPGEMVPYLLLGAGLQYISSKVFPWLGEKAGQRVYKNNLKTSGKNHVQKAPNVSDTTDNIAPKFSGIYNYGFNPKNNLKI